MTEITFSPETCLFIFVLVGLLYYGLVLISIELLKIRHVLEKDEIRR